MPVDVQLIMLAIRAAIRIAEQARHAFADSLRSAAITLPLPNFPAAPDLSSIENFYRDGDGKEFFAANLRVRTLVGKVAAQGPRALSAEEDKEIHALFDEHTLLIRARNGQVVGTAGAESLAATGLTDEDLVVLVSVRQWRKGHDPNPTVLRRLAGTLVNIAVDYAVSMPDLANSSSARSRLLGEFLSQFQDVDFVETAPTEIVPMMATSLLDFMSVHPELLVKDRRGQVLVQHAAGAVYGALNASLQAGLTLSEKDQRAELANGIFRALLRGAASAAVDNPELFLRASSPEEQDLLRSVAGALMDSLGDAAAGDPDRAFGSEAFARVAQAALLAVGRHPELAAKGSPFLTGLVRAMAVDVAAVLADSPGTPLEASTILPEVLRLVLVNTAGNLDALAPAGLDHPEKQLLVVATKEVLRAVAASPPAGAAWRTGFSEDEALRIIGVVVQEAAQNPGWVAGSIKDPLIAEIVRELLATMRRLGSTRLDSATAVAIVESVLRAMGRQYTLQLKTAAGKRYGTLALETVLAALFGPGASAQVTWVALRGQVVQDIVDAVFGVLVEKTVNDARVQALAVVLGEALPLLASHGAMDMTGFRSGVAGALK